MSDIEKIRNYIEENLSEKRLCHCFGVQKEAEKLAKIYGADLKKVSFAALAHDMAKEISYSDALKYLKKHKKEEILKNYNSFLIHGPMAAFMLECDFGVSDEEVLNAVFYHTTGRENMSLVEKIIYIADFTEEGRSFPEAEKAREISYKSLEDAIIYESGKVIIKNIEEGRIIHPDTVLTRNFYISAKSNV